MSGLKLYDPAPVRRTATRRRSHLPFDTGDPAPGGTYSVSTWDHEEGVWEPCYTGLRLMGLRRAVRDLERVNWSEASYFVERE